jgi:hypothetical protein
MRITPVTSLLLLGSLLSTAPGDSTNVSGQSPPLSQPALTQPTLRLLEPSMREGGDPSAWVIDGAACEGDSCTADDQQPKDPPSKADDLSPELKELRERVRSVLGAYFRRQLNTRDHNPWEVMHAIVAYGVDSELHRGGPKGETVNSIGWLCYNGACHGDRLLLIDRGRIAVRKGPSVQGHYGQFLAILAQSRVRTDYPLLVDGKSFTVADVIESEKLGCQRGIELTFKLLSLAHYLDLDSTWKNQSGEDWSIEKLVHEELAAPIRGAACGGTHRLMGLAYAVNKRQKSGQPINGEYLRAKTFLDDYHRYTLSLQNADGSFSTEWFNRRGNRADLGRRLQTTGHILEWLAYSLPQEMLTDPRIVKAVEYLTGILQDGEDRGWEIGPLGHGVHALAIYDSRVFKPHDTAAMGQNVARRELATAPSSPAARSSDPPSPDASSADSSSTADQGQAASDQAEADRGGATTGAEGPMLFAP